MEIRFSTSGYEEYESDILELRNQNREEAHSLEHMRWRYLGDESQLAPIIFWVQLADGSRVGMTGIIFRRYWVDGKLCHFAFSGDTSLDSRLRGRKIGHRLYEFRKAYVNEKGIKVSMSIPNEITRIINTKAGWKIEEHFVRYVFFIDPTAKIQGILKSVWMGKAVGRIMRTIIMIRIGWRRNDDLQLAQVNEFDRSFDEIWEALPKDNLIIRDRRAGSLNWRYRMHPKDHFKVAKMYTKGEAFGYVVYLLKGRRCHIYDYIVVDLKYVGMGIDLIVREMAARGDIDCVVLKANENNPYSKELLGRGFTKRKEDDLFMTYELTGRPIADNCQWFVTMGDKDV